jgi:hypothetical protein
MLGIPNGSRLDNALRANRGTISNARAKNLQNAQTKTTAKGDGKPIIVKGIDYNTGKKRVIRIKSKMLQQALRIAPSTDDDQK